MKKKTTGEIADYMLTTEFFSDITWEPRGKGRGYWEKPRLGQIFDLWVEQKIYIELKGIGLDSERFVNGVVRALKIKLYQPFKINHP